jgi:hypothetical protein
VDWSREGPPWLGDLSATIPGTNLERLAYFGWIWDHTDSIKVTVAKKADGASFNTAIWAVGGDAAGLEKAREAIREGLHVKWHRNLRKEGVTWLAKHAYGDPSQDEANRLAMVDCLTRLTNSDWWTGHAGSRLNFGVGPRSGRSRLATVHKDCIIRLDRNLCCIGPGSPPVKNGCKISTPPSWRNLFGGVTWRLAESTSRFRASTS